MSDSKENSSGFRAKSWLRRLRRLWQPSARQPSQKDAPRRLLFVFQGWQSRRPDMGRGLYEAEPIFRDMVRRCCREVERLDGQDLSGAFLGGDGWHESNYHSIVINSIVQLGLVALWQSLGVYPDGCVGLSLGEISSPFCLGALTPEETVTIARLPGMWDEMVPVKGVIVAILTDLETVKRIRREGPSSFTLLSEYGPKRIIVTVAPGDVASLSGYLHAHNITHFVGRDNAYHTPHLAIEPDLFMSELGRLQPQPLQYPYYSALGGGLLPASAYLDAAWWYWLIACPAFFHTTFTKALSDGYDTILNISPHPALTPQMRETAAHLGKDVLILDSLRKDEPETVTFRRTLETLTDLGLRSANGARKPGRRAKFIDANDADLFAEDVIQDPYPLYEALREGGPVHFLARHGFWLVLDYAEVVAALKQPQSFSNAPAQGLDPTLIGADPPAHTRARQALAPFFTPSAIAELAEFVSAQGAMLWQEAVQKTEFDFISEFAAPLSEQSAAHLLGLDADATAELRRLTSVNHYHLAAHYEAVAEFFNGYLRRNRHAANGLARALGERFTPEEAAGLLRALWLAGTTTTIMSIAAATHWLLRLPPLRCEILQDMALLPQYLEEVLRYDTPEQTAWRVTTQPAQLGGVTVPANAQVRLCLAAANRDPKHFANPNCLVLTRKQNDHLAFGLGPHYCLGAALSRLEARVALSVWLRATPGMQAAQPLNAMRYVNSEHFRALASLPVRVE